jgi:hypothetical protein
VRREDLAIDLDGALAIAELVCSVWPRRNCSVRDLGVVLGELDLARRISASSGHCCVCVYSRSSASTAGLLSNSTSRMRRSVAIALRHVASSCS